MQDNTKPIQPPKKKHNKDVIKEVTKQLKKKSKKELINMIINLSAKIDELKEGNNGK